MVLDVAGASEERGARRRVDVVDCFCLLLFLTLGVSCVGCANVLVLTTPPYPSWLSLFRCFLFGGTCCGCGSPGSATPAAGAAFQTTLASEWQSKRRRRLSAGDNRVVVDVVSGSLTVGVACLRVTTAWWLTCAGASGEHGEPFKQHHGHRRMLGVGVVDCFCLSRRVPRVGGANVSVPNDATYPLLVVIAVAMLLV